MRYCIFCCLLLCSASAYGQEIAGVMVQETIKTDDGTVLQLNGAGIRTKFFFDIYLAELYLEHPADNARAVIEADERKCLVMHFLYRKVEKEKLVDGWNEGFAGNTAAVELTNLRARIDQFNDMFDDVTKGDRIVLDYIPNKGTEVTVAGREKGIIAGKDFNDQLFRIWLGENPVNEQLKEKLLHAEK